MARAASEQNAILFNQVTEYYSGTWTGMLGREDVGAG
jgi:hypothetical protein